MKLYLLKPIDLEADVSPWRPWYDKAFGFLVRAETELEARTLADGDAGDENRPTLVDGSYDYESKLIIHPWLDPNLTSCLELGPGVDGPSEILLRDFASA